MNAFDSLKQQRFYQFFLDISAIPRGSGNEKVVSDYIARFAAENGLEAWQDRAWNVVVRKPASAGYEGAEPVVLQAHLDMVCEKTPESAHDFLRDPILPVERDGFLTAGSTTLGADNGVAVAYMLAVLEDKSLRHPPIEAVFTTNEETGMDGMHALDTSRLQGRRMLNLDSEEEGVLCAGCAGGIRYELTVPLTWRAPAKNGAAYRLSVGGLTGGHSGMDINKERGNALLLLARLLDGLRGKFGVQLADFCGGFKDNAIPRDAQADLLLNPAEASATQTEIQRLAERIQSEYAVTEPALCVALEPLGDAPAQVMDSESFRRALAAILLLPNGVLACNPLLPGETDSSSNLGAVAIRDGVLALSGLIRSNTNSRIGAILDRLEHLTGLLGAALEAGSSYPAWEFRRESALRALCADAYRELCGGEPATASIHAGLECALMAEKRPDMDMVSIGPNMYDVHTPSERADIASLLRVWEYLVRLLERMR